MQHTLSFQACHTAFPPQYKHFPFKPHLPHHHMALSALPNKQFTEPLTTTTLKPVLSVSCGNVSCFLKSAAFWQSLPALGPNTTLLPRKASLLHVSSLMGKTKYNTFFPFWRWSIFNYLQSHAAKALTVVMSQGVSLRYFNLATGKSEHIGNWYFGMKTKQFVLMINFLWFVSILFNSLQVLYVFLIHPLVLTQSVTHYHCAKLQGSSLCTCSITSLLFRGLQMMVVSEMLSNLFPYPSFMTLCILMNFVVPPTFQHEHQNNILIFKKNII